MICGHVTKFVMLSIILLDNKFIRFCSKLYRQIVGITMGTTCAPLVADLGAKLMLHFHNILKSIQNLT